MSVITVCTSHNINKEEIARKVGTRKLCFNTHDKGVNSEIGNYLCGIEIFLTTSDSLLVMPH